MNDASEYSASPSAPMPRPILVQPAPYSPRSPWRGVLIAFVLVLVLCGMPLGGMWLFVSALFRAGEPGETVLTERFHSGAKLAGDKIAIIRVDGVLMEGMIGYAQKQIERAMEDPQVKAVVLRVNSPGGSITASDDLHHRLHKLRDGDPLKQTTGKPIIVSMGSLAASGGYYIAMPGQTIFAERTSITGSIGVFAALPNVKELADKVGFKMNVIKRGGVKDSGSPFHEMKPHEAAVWQSMIDDAYERFKSIVEEGRPNLKGKLEEKTLEKTVTLFAGDQPDAKNEQVQLVRYRADGGTFTASEALKLGLIDQIGFLEDAVAEAKRAAKLTDTYKVITYDRPPTLFGLLGLEARQSGGPPSTSQAANCLIPRLWYLSSQAELAGMFQALSAPD